MHVLIEVRKWSKSYYFDVLINYTPYYIRLTKWMTNIPCTHELWQQFWLLINLNTGWYPILFYIKWKLNQDCFITFRHSFLKADYIYSYYWLLNTKQANSKILKFFIVLWEQCMPNLKGNYRIKSTPLSRLWNGM